MSEREMVERLERLERDNRRMKQGGLALLVMLVALTTIYATRPVPDVIKAHEFDLVDSSGTLRGTMGFVSKLEVAPVIYLYDAQGKTRVNIGVFPSGSPSIALYGARQSEHASMAVYRSGGGSIELTDAHGFGMELGSTSTTAPATGATQQTSAASIVMFGNDKAHHVIWRAP